MKKVIIIAEAGVNHNGSLVLAKKLIDVAAISGADFVKFQTWVTDELMEKDAPKAQYQNLNDPSSSNQYDMVKRLELSFQEFRELHDHCKLRNIGFLSTPDEEKSLDFLTNDLGLDLIKVGSGEVTNIHFLKKIGRKKLNVILSTGMSNLGEVEKAYETLLANGAKSVSLLHCTSEYPAPFDQINLKAMDTLRQCFETSIGYSDHTTGIEVSVAAVALGATIIEKHFTLDKTMAGPDHKASLDPVELKNLVSAIRNVQLAISGNGQKKPSLNEYETKKVVQKGLYLRRSLHKGEELTEENIQAKRPVKGIEASYYELIVGKKATKDLLAGQSLDFSDIQF
jgi:N-acetylneuraminate synthase